MTERIDVLADPASPFDLDIQVITDVPAGGSAPCATDDGCAPTCASSCASRG